MSLFTDTSDAPRIDDEKIARTETLYMRIGVGGGDGLAKSTRTITTSQYRVVGLTQAVADSRAVAESDTYHNWQRASVRMGEGQAYQLRVTVDSFTAWSTDTSADT